VGASIPENGKGSEKGNEDGKGDAKDAEGDLSDYSHRFQSCWNRRAVGAGELWSIWEERGCRFQSRFTVEIECATRLVSFVYVETSGQLIDCRRDTKLLNDCREQNGGSVKNGFRFALL
jgi:hypothetical protein